MAETLEPKASTFQFRGRKELFEALYKSVFPSVAAFVSLRKGSFQDAKDIFQDALIIFYEKSVVNSIHIETCNEAYLLGIAKHLWLRRCKQQHEIISLDDVESAMAIKEDDTPTVETSKLLLFLERAGRKCMDLLSAFITPGNRWKRFPSNSDTTLRIRLRFKNSSVLKKSETQ